MRRTNVDSVEEAVEIAAQLSRSTRPYWFRGQSNIWRVQSSFIRLLPDERQRALEKIDRYEQWIRQTPGLAYLKSNADAAVAVAQHYGIPTNFVDFTTRPEIAAFFATEHAGPSTVEDFACIICLDIEDFKMFWHDLLSKHAPPEFLQIIVPDLWRIEAQQGCFLFCPYEDIERIYDFDRIIFPNTHVFSQIKPESVYPARKSQLEIVLDQYFMNEKMIEGKRFWKSEGVRQIVIQAPSNGYDPDVFAKGLPDHFSWSESTLRLWTDLNPERFSEVCSTLDFKVRLPIPDVETSMVRNISEQLMNDLLSRNNIRRTLVNWSVEVTGGKKVPEDFSNRMAPKLARLWDGLRRLPFTDEEVCSGLGMCMALGITLGGDFQNVDARHWEQAASRCFLEPIELEFGTTDGSYSRGYVSSPSLAEAIRPDILTYVSNDLKLKLTDNLRAILQSSWIAKKTFDFRVLTTLFAKQLAPYQVLARSSAVFYSPARLMNLGLP